GGVPHVEELERLVVDVHHHRVGGVTRPTLCEHERQVEHLERVDPGDDQHEEGGGGQQRHGDVAEALKAVGAVDGGGLVEVDGDALEAGQEDQHVVAKAFPDGHDDDRWHGPGGAGEPGDTLHPD